jgi:hypothetical protein
VTKHHNTVFTVSAGNSGSSYDDRGSLNNPASALQCIAAAASDISGNVLASFSSKGPKPDYSIKPDLTAPGISIKGPSNIGDEYVSKSGTSMASPIIAGAAALLIDFARSQNISYSPGLIKAALLSGGKDMDYPVWNQGAGFINVTKAVELLNDTKKDGTSSNLLYTLPQELPFDPYRVLFPGSKVEFNLTIIADQGTEVEVIIPEKLSKIINVPETHISVDNSMLIPIVINIPLNYSLGIINSSITIGGIELKVDLEIRASKANILFDESLNRIVKHGFTTNVEEIQGDASNSIGMFSKFVQFLSYENNYSVTPHTSGDLTLGVLNQFDAIILPNPFSLASDVYMDWVNNAGNSFLSISRDSITALHDYVEGGGSLLILSTDSNFLNLTTLNELLLPFSLEISDSKTTDVIQTSIVDPQDWTGSTGTFPFRGNFIESTGDLNKIIAEYNGNPTLASYSNSVGGKVLLFGSDLTFDNIGFSSHSYYGDSEHNKLFAFNAVAWLVGGEYREVKNPMSIDLYESMIIILFAILIFLIAIAIINLMVKKT